MKTQGAISSFYKVIFQDVCESPSITPMKQVLALGCVNSPNKRVFAFPHKILVLASLL